MTQILNDDFNTPKPLAIPQNDRQELEARVDKLKKICKLIDPYLPIPDDLKRELKDFGIVHFYDPFAITNKLLLELEDSIEALESLKKTSPTS